MKRVRAVIKAHTKDTALVTRNLDAVSSSVVASCLTSGQNFLSAPEASGLLQVSSDSCTINRIQFKGRLLLPPLPTTLDQVFPTYVRKLLVWFHKPLLAADDNATLPPITEVLRQNSIDSLFISDSANGGRFEVLYDHLWDLGINSSNTNTTTNLLGKPIQYYDVDIPCDLQLSFVAPPTASIPGGHYDSTESAGRVSTGLLVLYTQVVTTTAATVDDHMTSIINYTG